jgi:hypothetical protein
MPSIIATAVLAVASINAGAAPLQWEPSYGKALEAARADQQPLLVVLDKPGTADASLASERLRPADDNIEAELLKRYELCHVDVTTDYGRRVAEAFKAKSFPYVAVIDKTGSVVMYSKAGKFAEGEWEQMLVKYRSGDRSLAVSRVTYKPTGSIMFQNPTSGSLMSGSCPSCQRRAF